jgi:SAM-dependent methyltransferase
VTNSGYQTVDREFYVTRDAATRPSAETVVSILLEIVQLRSAVDLGCGVGTWLSVLRARGVTDVYGIEADEVPPELLRIPRESFARADLRRPVELSRAFDLALSLEVAEHLPASTAAVFVESLVKLAPVVLFSAAIPGQGGIHHVNEQWPQYWGGLFAKHDYVMIDAIRRRIWRNEDVKVWYRQNIVMFARRDMVESHASLRRAFEATDIASIDVVHPKLFVEKVESYERRLEAMQNQSLRQVLRMLPGTVRRRLGSWATRASSRQ